MIEFNNNQKQILNFINKMLNFYEKDSKIKDCIINVTKDSFYKANAYSILQEMGCHGFWVKLKNKEFFHVMLFSVDFFFSVPALKINTTGFDSSTIEQFVYTTLFFDEEGITWWKDKPKE